MTDSDTIHAAARQAEKYLKEMTGDNWTVDHVIEDGVGYVTFHRDSFYLSSTVNAEQGDFAARVAELANTALGAYQEGAGRCHP